MIALSENRCIVICIDLIKYVCILKIIYTPNNFKNILYVFHKQFWVTT
jgi:hypothetical protein